jgi:hypothetical protein
MTCSRYCMRADMAKVIVERPRIQGRACRKPKGYARRLLRYGEDGPPMREGIKACWGHGTKFLNEHLGPLRRYLDKQVGRPWDKVFSEICAHIDRNSAVQDHVRDHVQEYVVTHVVMIDGVPCNGGPGRNYGARLDGFYYRRWYVCPRTGLLRRIKQVSRKRLQPTPPAKPPIVSVSDVLQCRHLNGGWRLVTLAPLPTPPSARQHSPAIDVLLNRPVAQLTPIEAVQIYGAAVYAAGIRQLTRAELHQFPIPMQWW